MVGSTANQEVTDALAVIAEHGADLDRALKFDWPGRIQQAVHRLRLAECSPSSPPFIAVVGGASSGKSTVFNNLIDGHLASRITARGHTTIGPIMAIHETHRATCEKLIAQNRFFPTLGVRSAELDDNVTGEPDEIVIVYHAIDDLRDCVLLDLPDFTSQAAHHEGDVTLSLLPWFDRLIIVMDHERWFDRQSISTLRTESARFAQDRWVLFNRTQEGDLAEADLASLSAQSDRLGGDGMTVLDFRRGRGFCVFSPETLDDVRRFAVRPAADRTGALLAQVTESVNRVLNQNEERSARLDTLQQNLATTVERAIPTVRDCLTSLMTPAERRQVDVVSRVLRLTETKQWLGDQARRMQQALGRVPLLGTIVGSTAPVAATEGTDETDRSAISLAYFENVSQRLTHDVKRSLNGSAFWDELRRWTSMEPAQRSRPQAQDLRERIVESARRVDHALTAWLNKVESECAGISPNITGAIGIGTLGLAVILIAAPGPVAALTLVSAKGAIGAALTQLVTAAGAGAVLGKPTGRLVSVIQEQLVGSAEFNAVLTATSGFHALLRADGAQQIEEAVAEASSLVLDVTDPLAAALGTLRDAAEDTG